MYITNEYVAPIHLHFTSIRVTILIIEKYHNIPVYNFSTRVYNYNKTKLYFKTYIWTLSVSAAVLDVIRVNRTHTNTICYKPRVRYNNSIT